MAAILAERTGGRELDDVRGVELSATRRWQCAYAGDDR